MKVRHLKDGSIVIETNLWWVWCKRDHVETVSPASSHVFPIWLPLSVLSWLLQWFAWIDSQTEEG